MPTDPRPNIVWITCHDISPDLGCYAGIWPGAEYAYTPNLDQLANEGMRYDHAYAVAPVCAPSRSAIITGCFPTAIGTMHMRSHAVLPEEIRCFPEYLRAAGYYCSNFFTDYQFQTPVTVWDDCSPQAHWRNRPDPDQPFFAVFSGMMTHESQIDSPGMPREQIHAKLPPAARHDPAQAPLPPYYPDTPVMRQAWANYSDNISLLDLWVGDLLQQLAEDGLAEKTLVVFWSDHGRGFPRAKRWPYESGLHEPLIVRWPGKIAPGRTNTDLVYLMDLAATMLEVVGLPIPGHMHAQPLFDRTGQLRPGRQYLFGHRDRMDETEDTMRSVRDQRFRYIRNSYPERPYAQHLVYAEQMSTWKELRRLRFEEATMQGRGEQPNLLTPVQRRFLASNRPAEELYDLQADPHEITNLAADPAYQADLLRLRTAVDAWQAEVGDLGLIPEQQLIAQWRPAGHLQQTAPPTVALIDGLVVATCATAGASLAWTIDPPDPSYQPSAFARITGDPDTGGRSWRLYTTPLDLPPGTTLWIRAHRIGFRASEDCQVTLPE
ncbi:MAG: sulfatase-like hydrolase/transferase [Roseiflexaceae bacterium]